MHINNRYNYQPLTRFEDSDGFRKYNTPSGEQLASVTTILSATVQNPFIDEWIKNVGEFKAEQVRDEASTLGSFMHNNLENYVLNKPMTGSFMGVALAKLIVKHGLSRVNEVWGTEVSLYYPGCYAGTADLIGLHDNISSIMDFKNSLRKKSVEDVESYGMQLAAYALAHNSMFDTNIQRGVIMMATRNAEYQEFIFEGEEFLQYQHKWIAKVTEFYSQNR